MSVSDPLRLALVITELHPGGAERCLVELATRIDRQRFSPVVYSLGPIPPADRQLLVEHLTEARIPTHFLDLTSPWQFLSGVKRLAAHLHEQRCEIVQSFLFHANVLAARAAKRANVAHLVSGIRVADPRASRSLVERLATRHADAIVCVSQAVAKHCHSRGFNPAKLAVISNGIDVAKWRDALPADLTPFGIPAGRRAIVFVGRLDAQKGLDDLAVHLPSIFAELPSHDLLVVGDGPQPEPLIAPRIHFAGWQSDIPGILAAADLLILPSRWEGMPNVILEAMAAKKPVLANRAEGVIELLGDAADQQTAEIGKTSDFAEKLLQILRNAPLAGLLGSRNHERAIQQFSIENMVARYERLYFKLAGN